MRLAVGDRENRLLNEPTFPDLRTFIEQLRSDGQLAVVDAEVDARLEVAEIHRRVIAAGGPALLFTRVRDAEMPLVTNLFGTPQRAERAFGRRPGRLIRRLVDVAETMMPPAAARRARDWKPRQKNLPISAFCRCSRLRN